MTLEQARELLALHDKAFDALGRYHGTPTDEAWTLVRDADMAFRDRLFDHVDWKAG